MSECTGDLLQDLGGRSAHAALDLRDVLLREAVAGEVALREACRGPQLAQPFTEQERLGLALDSLLKLNGVTYFWKDSSRGPSRQIGLIAQDVEKAFPEAIKPRQDGLLGLSYESLVGPLVEGIKELYAKWSADHKLLEKQEVKLGQLEKKLEIENLALKAENKALKERVDKIEEALAAAPAQAPAKKGRKLASK